jgi:ssDNA thymidine ADP-ribosyltransferase DarT-like protein
MAGREAVAAQIKAEAEAHEISRLCHLTPFRNLLHIVSGDGLKSVAELEGDRAAFDQQDLERLDQRPDHISCSVEYPNIWYLRRRLGDATPLQRLFPDWVCLLIDPKHLWAPGTEFAPRNAAAGGGAYLRPGYEAFCDMYPAKARGAYGKFYGRGQKPSACPTDDQAEVMIEKHIPLADASTIVFGDVNQAARNVSALRLLKVPVENFKLLIAPSFFKTELSAMLRGGEKPTETPWVPNEQDA